MAGIDGRGVLLPANNGRQHFWLESIAAGSGVSDSSAHMPEQGNDDVGDFYLEDVAPIEFGEDAQDSASLTLLCDFSQYFSSPILSRIFSQRGSTWRGTNHGLKISCVI